MKPQRRNWHWFMPGDQTRSWVAERKFKRPSKVLEHGAGLGSHSYYSDSGNGHGCGITGDKIRGCRDDADPEIPKVMK